MSTRGRYHSGLAAEDIAERHYQALGAKTLAWRWRSDAGEIDLIFDLADTIVFVEVKARRNLDGAAAAITRRQLDRIAASAELFMAQTGRSGGEMRIDAALVDRTGSVQIIENAGIGE